MGAFNIFLFLLLCLLVNYSRADNGKRIVCYYASWAHYRQGEGNFKVEDVPANLCTHLIYSFAGLNPTNNEIKPLDSWLDLTSGLNGYGRAVALKNINPDLKVLLAIGGWSEGSTSYSNMAATSTDRSAFISSVISLLLSYGFDGLDIDWEYPAQRGGAPEDKQNLILLLQEMRTEFDTHGLLLTIAVGMGKDLVDTSYDLPAMAGYLDFINMMTYDFRGSWDAVTGHQTQLFKRPEDQGSAGYLNVDSSVKLWTDKGVPKSKLNLGMAFYGRTYKVSSNNGPLDNPFDGAGLSGPYTQSAGFIGYNEFCLNLLNEVWTIDSNSYVAAPWAYKGEDWVAYDNITSIATKSTWGMNLGLGGGMMWSLDMDDFRGLCGQGTFPLLTTMNSIWMNPSITTSSTTTTIAMSPTTPSTSSASTITTPSTSLTSTATATTTSTSSTATPTTPSITSTSSTTTATTIPSTTSTSTTTTTTTPLTTSGPSAGSTCNRSTDTNLIVDPANCTRYLQCSPKRRRDVWISRRCPKSLYFDPSIQACNWPSSNGGCY